MQRMTSKGRAGPAPSLFRLTLQVSDIMEGRQALEMTLPVLSLRWVDGCHWQPNLTNVCLLSLRTQKPPFIPFENGHPAGPPRDILSGFLAPDERVSYGRPVGVTLGPDGSVLMADDVGDVIWRVTGKLQG